MSTFSGSTTGGIVLGDGTYTNPLTVTLAAYVTNTGTPIAHKGDAIYGTGTAWTLSNFGTIKGAALTNAYGVNLRAGGSVTNGSAVSTAPQISGQTRGVWISGGAGTVSNFGTVTATAATGQGIILLAG